MSERSEPEIFLGCIFPSALFPFFALLPFRALCVVGRALCVVVMSSEVKIFVVLVVRETSLII